MLEAIKSPSCSSPGLPSPLHPHVDQPLLCVASVQEEFLIGHLHLGHFLWPFSSGVGGPSELKNLTQWCLFERHPVEETVWFSPNQKCPANSVCSMLKAQHPSDSKESHPDHSDDGNIYPVISDLNIIYIISASCKLFCNLPDSFWYLDSVCKWQIEG